MKGLWTTSPTHAWHRGVRGQATPPTTQTRLCGNHPPATEAARSPRTSSSFSEIWHDIPTVIPTAADVPDVPGHTCCTWQAPHTFLEHDRALALVARMVAPRKSMVGNWSQTSVFELLQEVLDTRRGCDVLDKHWNTRVARLVQRRQWFFPLNTGQVTEVSHTLNDKV